MHILPLRSRDGPCPMGVPTREPSCQDCSDFVVGTRQQTHKTPVVNLLTSGSVNSNCNLIFFILLDKLDI
ncbi:hypothetical protein L6452_39685 [Arctium lappa]|uniref:Uncharacterized protein n=1 Tax=Arctium lappa TaxID=4217 RepID=A0ACB8XUN7_ARCLA|nr:hypothetical protein L6452_39685 [Arctium lappa]